MMKQTGRSGVGVWLFRSALCVASAGAASALGQPSAVAQEENASKAVCARAYESSQESRAAGQLLETRTRLLSCARPECPSFVQKDCARWLEEVERELPSIVVSAPGLAAEAANAVRVTIDGNVAAGALGGEPITLDPGPHELVAERPGHPPIERVILAQQGVQNRVVTLDFGATAVSTPAPAPASDAPVDVAPEGGSSLRPYAYVAWGVGAVGLGAFAVLGTLGRADERGLKDDCPNATTDPMLVAPGICLSSRVEERKDIYEREFLLADVGLVTGIAGAALGAALFVLSADDAPQGSVSRDERWRLGVSPTTGGAFASVARGF